MADSTISCSSSERLQGMKFDSTLKFGFQIEQVCQKASGKRNALSYLEKYMGLPKILILMNI